MERREDSGLVRGRKRKGGIVKEEMVQRVRELERGFIAKREKEKRKVRVVYYLVVFRCEWEEGGRFQFSYSNAVISLARTLGRDNVKALIAKVKVLMDKDNGKDNNIVLFNVLPLRNYKE